jgi:SAM-dependent methyltransferase
MILSRFLPKKDTRQKLIQEYLASGCRPWSEGYMEYRDSYIEEIFSGERMALFPSGHKLPEGFGSRLDERVVEYPWALSRLGAGDRLLLDAGSTLNHQYILDLDILACRSIVIYTLSPERVISRANVSYIYGDLRSTILRSEYFDEIVCISTLEHIGMNNTLLYSKDARYNEQKNDDYVSALKEFKRLLKPSGKLLITVPYGRYENHGWLQQFDERMIDKMIEELACSQIKIMYYRYLPGGWQIAEKGDCSQCSYYNIHNRSDFDPDYAAAARAVACLEIIK